MRSNSVPPSLSRISVIAGEWRRSIRKSMRDIAMMALLRVPRDVCMRCSRPISNNLLCRPCMNESCTWTGLGMF